MKFKETIKETPCICVYCLVPHTLSPSRRLNSESQTQTHWSSGLTLSLKKKVKYSRPVFNNKVLTSEKNIFNFPVFRINEKN